MLERRYVALILFLISTMIVTSVYYYAQRAKPSKTIYSGFRALGWRGFSTGYWVNLTKRVTSSIPGTSPAGIAIVGRVSIQTGRCILSFPSNQTYPNIVFETRDIDEDYFKAFDDNRIKIWLQVEPGFADIDQLIDLVLGRYRHHPCVLGLGIDLEWRWGDTKETVPVADEEATHWVNKIKQYNPDFKLFLKHWLPKNMPPTAREGIVFIDDAQNFEGLDSLVDEFKSWGENFSQTDVGYQVGYRRDQGWWSQLKNPPKEIGSALIQNIPNCRHIFWTDETLHEFFKPS